MRPQQVVTLIVSADRRSLSNTETGNSSTIHQTVQPVVHVSPDGKSATIRARLLKVGGKPVNLRVERMKAGRQTVTAFGDFKA